MLKYHIHIHNFTSQYTCPPAPQHTLLHTYLLEGRLEREALYFVKQLFLTTTTDRPNLKIRLC